MPRLTVLMSVLSVICSAAALHAEDRGIRQHVQRLALVIGNGAYLKSAPLENPVNDAVDVASVLTDMGFEVVLRLDADQKTMEDAIRYFGRMLNRGGVGLFYFAGHGVQLEGRNFLLPIDARIESESDVKYEAVDAGLVLGKMEDAENQLNIVILDACRNNPYAKAFRSDQGGLARMDAPKGSIIAYATAPGEVAADGPGRNGLFTTYLIQHIRTPGLTIEQILKRVRIDVAKHTDNRQIPWESSSLMGDFYFQASTKVETQGDSPNRPPSGGINPHAAASPDTEDKILPPADRARLAVLPMQLAIKSGGWLVSYSYPKLEKIIISSLEQLMNDDELSCLKYSYYHLNTKCPVEMLPGNLKSDDITDRMWHKQPHSNTSAPNIDLFCEIGTRLQVDAILTYLVSVDNGEQIAKSFLVDVKGKKLVERQEADDLIGTMTAHYASVLPDRIRKLTLRVVKDYKSAVRTENLQ